MKYIVLFVLIIFSFWIEGGRFFTFEQLFISVIVGAVSGFIWELCKFICAKIDDRDIGLEILIPGIVLIGLAVSLGSAYLNYEIGAKSALFALYSGFFVSEICADYGSKINKQAQKIMSRLKNNEQVQKNNK